MPIIAIGAANLGFLDKKTLDYFCGFVITEELLDILETPISYYYYFYDSEISFAGLNIEFSIGIA